MQLFRELEEEEVEEFREWARQNYTPFSSIKGTWHPEVQKECIKINEISDVKIFDDALRLGITQQKQKQTEVDSN